METSPAVDADREDQAATKHRARLAAVALLAATVFWGFGFTWAKEGGANANRLSGLSHGNPLGPIWLLCVRFLSAGILWLAIIPAARRGWTLRSLGRGVGLGAMLAAGLITQHLGLDRSSEAVTAFLTSLTILFVPLIMTLVLGRPSPWRLWAGVVLATIGVWLMTGASPRGFGLGECLAIGCAVIFSVQLIALNYLVAADDPARIAAAEFLTVGVITGIICLCLKGGPHALSPARALQLIVAPGIGWNLLLMVLLVTIGSFGLQTYFQPRVDPTRAVLLYLCEPIFASVYAWIIAGRGLGKTAVVGALLILCANALVELLQSRKSNAAGPSSPPDAPEGAKVMD
ncbi:MAG TPA: DMT family transporter [Tepidisphaeraceae bacterium]|jgi:drug/metabolite transporter (DMT)-like permease